MPDAPASDAASPADHEENADEEDGTPAAESEVDEGPTTPAPQPTIRKKRLGRPPKNRPADWDDGEPVSETGTPKRGRGRGGFGKGGGRWGMS